MIGFLEKTSRERVQVAWREYAGHRFVDVRVHFTTDGGETFKPSAKGCTVRPDQIGQLISLLRQAQAEAEAVVVTPEVAA